jgi:hypothetical protein
LIASLVEEHHTDVLVLAECEIDQVQLLLSLNGGKSSEFHIAPGLAPTIRVFTRFPSQFLRKVSDGERYSIRELRLPGCVSVLLAMLHLPILFMDERSQDLECTMTIRRIRDAETQLGHERTIVIGDFNMDPFDAGIVGAAGFNAVMHRTTAHRGSRTIRGETYPFFYNPMWNHFGDDRQPPGTYYYGKGDHVTYYWHMFDQVLIRSGLLSRLPIPGVTIPTAAGSVSLLRANGRPDTIVGSDHLPILFSLDLQEEDL